MIANKLLNGHKGFYASVKGANYYNNNCPSRSIADAMLKIHTKYKIEVVEYYKWNPFSSEQAYFSPKKPLKINLNKWKSNNKSKYSFINTLIHEFVHVVDNQYMHLEFGHTFRNHDKRKDSAPYRIGYIAENLAKAYY